MMTGPDFSLDRRTVLATGASLVAAGCVSPNGKGGVSPKRTAGEWPVYGGDNGASKYSALDQITASNFSDLKIAWEWMSPDADILAKQHDLAPGEFQATPIMVDGKLFTSTAMCQIAAIDPENGRTIWRRDPETWRHGPPTSKGFQHRGVAFWQDRQSRGRIFIATGDNRLIALDAETGASLPAFGHKGEIDLTIVGQDQPVIVAPRDVYGTTSPPVVCRDTVIVGQYIHDRLVRPLMPAGVVQAFDAATGDHKWTFHMIPRKGEAGYDTWLDGSAERNGNANVWAPMSADDELGIIYLPGSCPTNNFFGGARPGDNLFGNSLVALDVQTGQRLWHFQAVHHDIWDYDLPCAPNLIDITVGGRRIRAVAQVTKQGFCFVFDRVTGKPVWPIEEHAVPASPIAPERTSPTQPFPTRPAPFERQGLTEDDLIDFTPELRAEARAILAQYHAGGLFTPFGEKPTTVLPSWVGGANWGGAAADPETGLLYIPSITALVSMALDQTGARKDAGDAPDEIAGRSTLVRGPRGLPLIKPPYGRITAIDLNTGEHVWMRPNGPGAKDTAAFAPYNTDWLGTNGRTGPLLTRSLLIMGEGPHSPAARKVLRAYDKATGEVRGEVALPDHTLGPPMTYMAGGRQFIVCGMGFRGTPHRLVALALP